MRRLGEAWRRFWHTPAESSTLTLFRVALGFVVLCWSLSLGLDLEAFYSERGLLPSPEYPTYRVALFRWLDGDAAIGVVYLVLLGSSLAVTLGRGFRIAAILMWLSVCSFQFDNPYVLNGGDVLIRVLCAYLALYALLTPNSGGAGLASVVARERSTSFPVEPTWMLRLVQVQLTLIYLFSVIDKFRGDTWLNGTATAWALQLVEFQRFPVPPVFVDSLLAASLLTYGVLALECALPFLLWTRRTRRTAIGLGMGLHLSLNYALRLGFFGWIMIVAYLAFLTPAEANRALAWLRNAIETARRCGRGSARARAMRSA